MTEPVGGAYSASAEASGVLEFLTHKEDPVGFAARFGADRRLPGRPSLVAREVTLGAGWPVHQYRLPLSGQADPQAYAALERKWPRPSPWSGGTAPSGTAKCSRG